MAISSPKTGLKGTLANPKAKHVSGRNKELNQIPSRMAEQVRSTGPEIRPEETACSPSRAVAGHQPDPYNPRKQRENPGGAGSRENFRGGVSGGEGGVIRDQLTQT